MVWQKWRLSSARTRVFTVSSGYRTAITRANTITFLEGRTKVSFISTTQTLVPYEPTLSSAAGNYSKNRDWVSNRYAISSLWRHSSRDNKSCGLIHNMHTIFPEQTVIIGRSNMATQSLSISSSLSFDIFHHKH